MLKVLVTRPEEVASELCEAIERQGWQALRYPTLQIESIPIQNMPHHAKRAIFTSQAAVHHGYKSLPEDCQVIAIGPGTAKALSHYGIEALTAPYPYESESLLSLPSLQSVREQPILLFKGEGGRDLIEKTLTDRGAQTIPMICYRRRIASMTLAERFKDLSNAFNVIVTTSADTLNHLMTLSEEYKITDIPLIVVRTRMRELAEHLGFETIIEVDDASLTSLLNALHHTQEILYNP